MIGDAEYCIKAVQNYKSELKSSSWTQNFLKTLREYTSSISEIRCLALGLISEYINPRFQLALLLMIKDEFEVKKITSWDPINNEIDNEVLAHFEIAQVEEDNNIPENGLWYVPHGPLTLNLNLIDKVGEAVYIGNNFKDFDLEDNPAVSKYLSECRWTPLKSRKQDRWFTAFNSTAIYKRHSEQ